MAYVCEYQNEIQSALSSRNLIQLFTGGVFYNNDCKIYLICSETKDKDKDSVNWFIEKLYGILTSENSNTDTETLFTDRPSSEFKFMMKLLHQLSLQCNKTFESKYFATSHGKGVVNGVVGRIKKLFG